MPVAAVEIEVSLQAYEQQTKDGKHIITTVLHPLEAHQYSVIATCKELGIAVIAYSYAPSPPSPPSHRRLLLKHFQQSARSWITHRSDQEPTRL